MYFYPPGLPLVTQLKHVELCEGLIDFCRTFQLSDEEDDGIQYVERHRRRFFFLECEPHVWMILALVKEELTVDVGGYPRSLECSHTASNDSTGGVVGAFKSAVPYSGPPVTTTDKDAFFGMDGVPTAVLRGIMRSLWERVRLSTGGVCRVTAHEHAASVHAAVLKLREKIRKAEDKLERLEANAAYTAEHGVAATVAGGPPSGSAQDAAGGEELSALPTAQAVVALELRILRVLLRVLLACSPVCALRRVLREELDFALFYQDWSMPTALDAPTAIRYHPPSADLEVLLRSFVGNMASKHPSVQHVAVLFDGHCVWGRHSPGFRALYDHTRALAFHTLQGQYKPDRRDYDTCTAGLAREGELPRVGSTLSALLAAVGSGAVGAAGAGGGSGGGPLGRNGSAMSLLASAGSHGSPAPYTPTASASLPQTRLRSAESMFLSQGGDVSVTAPSQAAPTPPSSGGGGLQTLRSALVNLALPTVDYYWSGPVDLSSAVSVLSDGLRTELTEADRLLLRLVCSSTSSSPGSDDPGWKGLHAEQQALLEPLVQLVAIPFVHSALTGSALPSQAGEAEGRQGNAMLAHRSRKDSGAGSSVGMLSPASVVSTEAGLDTPAQASPPAPGDPGAQGRLSGASSSAARLAKLREVTGHAGPGPLSPASAAAGLGSAIPAPLPRQVGPGSGWSTFLRAARPSKLGVPAMPAAASALGCLRGPLRSTGPQEWPVQTLPYVSGAYLSSLSGLCLSLGSFVPTTGLGEPAARAQEDALGGSMSTSALVFAPAAADTGGRPSLGGSTSSGGSTGKKGVPSTPYVYCAPLFLHSPAESAAAQVTPSHRLLVIQQSLFTVLCWVEASALAPSSPISTGSMPSPCPSPSTPAAATLGVPLTSLGAYIMDVDTGKVNALLSGLCFVVAAYLSAIEPQTSAWFDRVASRAESSGVEECPALAVTTGTASLDVHGIEAITRAPGKAKATGTTLVSQARPTPSSTVSLSVPHGLWVALACASDCMGGMAGGNNGSAAETAGKQKAQPSMPRSTSVPIYDLLQAAGRERSPAPTAPSGPSGKEGDVHGARTTANSSPSPLAVPLAREDSSSTLDPAADGTLQSPGVSTPVPAELAASTGWPQALALQGRPSLPGRVSLGGGAGTVAVSQSRSGQNRAVTLDAHAEEILRCGRAHDSVACARYALLANILALNGCDPVSTSHKQAAAGAEPSRSQSPGLPAARRLHLDGLQEGMEEGGEHDNGEALEKDTASGGERGTSTLYKQGTRGAGMAVSSHEHLYASRHQGAVVGLQRGGRGVYLMVPPGPASKGVTSDGKELDGHSDVHTADLLVRVRKMHAMLHGKPGESSQAAGLR